MKSVDWWCCPCAPTRPIWAKPVRSPCAAPRLTVYTDPDGSARTDYFVMHLPQACLVDRKGRVVARAFGVFRWTGSEVDRLLSACLDAPDSDVANEDEAF